ncbi:hypothetical protein [Nocardia brasiliensis]|uniref:hypothetical protein n=1 Tax=Nocardia brasiliensis TaxID=37326 RepID=UPI0004A6EE21|nr:hypothetical protein [Nocardia brasiliensis]
MALKDVWFSPEFHVAFPKGLFLLGNVSPLTKFQRDRNAPVIQEVDMDQDGNGTGKRLWKATVTDPTAENVNQVGFQVVFVADVMPVPAAAEIVPGMTPIELEGLQIKPKMAGAGEFKRIGWSIRATGIKGDSSGSVAPGDHSASSSRGGKAAA